VGAGSLTDDHGRRELLDVTAEPRHQPGPSGLAASRVGRRTFDMLRPRERGGLPEAAN